MPPPKASKTGFNPNLTNVMDRRMFAWIVNLLGSGIGNFSPDDDSFRLVLHFLDRTEAEKVRTRLGALMRPGWQGVGSLADRDDPFGNLASLWRRSSPGLYAVRTKILRVFQSLNRRLQALPPIDDDRSQRIRQIQETLRLSDLETECLHFFFLAKYDRRFHQAIHTHMSVVDRATLHLELLPACMDVAPAQVRTLVMADAPLRRLGLVDPDLELPDEIHNFICGLGGQALRSLFYRTCEEPGIGVEAFPEMAPHVEVLARLLQSRPPSRAVNILLYGPPGTGKTEFARSLAQHVGKALVAIRQPGELSNRESDTTKFRFCALRGCCRAGPVDTALVLVDEADAMLNTTMDGGGMPPFMRAPDGAEKGMLNELLDRHGAAVVWIVNRVTGMDESTRRRFDYSIEFRRFSPAQRAVVWRRTCARHGLAGLTDADIERLARTHEVDAGGIDLAVRNAQQLTGGGVKALAPAAAIEQVLEPHLRLLGRPRLSSQDMGALESYCLEGLNVHATRPLPEVLQYLGRFLEHVDKAGSPAGPVRSMNLLMAGPPGTGKTEFAKFISRELGRSLVVRRTSDLLNLYVGETEKNIRRAFQDAEAQRSLLFFDEADSLFHARGNAQRSWEVSMVNELLTGMETYRGVVLCATNFQARMDPATLRRFAFKLEFDYLTEAGKRLLFAKILEPLAGQPLEAEEAAELAKIPCLAPGDFHVVRQMHLFLAPEASPNRLLIEELRAETGHRKAPGQGRIGFAAA